MNNTNPTPHPPAGDEPVWTFRGYTMRPAEFNTAMVHFYRAEIQRANTWRNRLDTTTNWAIITAGAAISFSLSEPSRHHGLLLLNIALIVILLFIEARRYRYYELWSQRTRLMETEFFAAMLVPPFAPSPEWAGALAASLLKPKFPISTWEAVGRRLRRNYFAIFAVLILAWLFKNYTQPQALEFPAPVTWGSFVANARIGTLPGELVISALVLFSLLLVITGIATTALQNAPGEVLPEQSLMERLHLTKERKKHAPPSAPPRAGRFVALIVSANGAAVSARVRTDLGCDLSPMNGDGQPSVLVGTLPGGEVERFRRAAAAADPAATVVVMPTA
ncbi:MAG: DUF2270 domain-containing protein [Chloroflexi bacterium]|nr:DUF2270 domain-containing protein [Chloroflexota bacterium]